MKKKVFISLLCTLLSVTGYSVSVSAETIDYHEDSVSFSYDNEIFDVKNETGTDIVVAAKNLPDDGGGHNTVLGCVIRDNSSSSYATYGMSDDELIYFKENIVSDVCQGVFEIDDGVTISDEGYENTGDYCEYHMYLSDGSKCYTKLLHIGSDTYTLLMRLCPYSADLNDAYKQVYDSFNYSYQNPNDAAEAAREPFEANLSCGFYIPGIDIPEGTYDLTAVSGSGNVYMFSKINEIMSNENKEYYIPTFNGASISGKSPLVISGDLVLNIKSDSARTQEMSPRVIASEVQTDLGAGNYTAGASFPVGTYNIICTSGSGNIYSYEAQINEVLNADSNSYGVQRINNVSFSDGDALEISGCAVQLQPVGE